MIVLYIRYWIREKKRWGNLIKRLKSKPRGIVFGKSSLFKVICSKETEQGHVGIWGGSGSGKTASVLIPTLRSWSGTALVIDISGDVTKRVDKINKICFEPENANTVPYNVFAFIDATSDEHEQNERLQQLSFSIIPSSPTDGDATKYYKNESRRLFQASLIAYYHAGLDFTKICHTIVSLSFQMLLKDLTASNNQTVIQLISSFSDGHEKTLATIKQELDSNIMLFATNVKMQNCLSRGHGSTSPLDLDKNSLYIIIDDIKLELYAPLLRLITAQTMEFLFRRENGATPHILMALDEFASFGKLDITPALRKLRKKNVRCLICTQSLADLDLIYGKEERKVMLDNLDYKIILSASDYDTQLYFSNLCGEYTTYKTTSGAHGDSYSESLSKRVRPEEFATLKNKLIFLHPRGMAILKKNYYFKRI